MRIELGAIYQVKQSAFTFYAGFQGRAVEFNVENKSVSLHFPNNEVLRFGVHEVRKVGTLPNDSGIVAAHTTGYR